MNRVSSECERERERDKDGVCVWGEWEDGNVVVVVVEWSASKLVSEWSECEFCWGVAAETAAAATMVERF